MTTPAASQFNTALERLDALESYQTPSAFAFTQTFSTTAATVPSPSASNPAAATASAVTDSSTGVASGMLAANTNPDLSAWNGSTDPTAAQATAINASITSSKNAVSSLAAQVNDLIIDNASMRTQITNLVADSLVNRELINKLIDVLQASHLAS